MPPVVAADPAAGVQSNAASVVAVVTLAGNAVKMLAAVAALETSELPPASQAATQRCSPRPRSTD